MSGLLSVMSSFSLATLPTSLNAKTSFFLSPSTARPAESYPRYSSRERPYLLLVVQDGIMVWPQPTVNECIENVFTIFWDEVVDVSEDSTIRTTVLAIHIQIRAEEMALPHLY